jgi:hypothetical protein
MYLEYMFMHMYTWEQSLYKLEKSLGEFFRTKTFRTKTSAPIISCESSSDVAQESRLPHASQTFFPIVYKRR